VFTIQKAAAGVTLGGLNPTYDGTAKSVTVTTEPSGLGTSVTYDGLPNAPTNAGSYVVVGSVVDANYTGSATNNLVIAKAGSLISVTGTNSFTYNGNPQGPDSSSKSGSSGAVSYSYAGTNGTTYGASATKPTEVGSYTVVASVAGDDNYNGESSTALVFTIQKASQTITFNL